jgi:release factor glutamine methyltransferase
MTTSARSTVHSERLDVEDVCGLRITVLPDVFNPVLMRTGELFATVLNSNAVGDHERVLDMGTGTGVCALVAARRARQVVAVDINPAAVECATLNVRAHHCEQKIEVRCGDLYAPVAHERFDLILFNPPFLVGAPQSDYDRAWRSTDVVPRFAAGLQQHLTPGGAALVLLSTFGNSIRLLDHFVASGLACSTLATRRYDNETLTIYRVTASP